MNTYEEKECKMDGRTILVMMMMAVMGAVGILSLCCKILGVRFTQLEWTVLAGLISGLSGLLFGIILLFHCISYLRR